MGALVLFCFVLLSPIAAQAHGNGASFEREVGPYRVDVGYDPAALSAGAMQVFDIALIDATTENQVKVEEIWVRITGGARTLLASGLRESEFGKTTLLYAMPEDGEYALHVSFRRGQDTLAEASFPFLVAPAEEEGVHPFDIRSATLGAGAALILVGVSLLFYRRYRTQAV